MSDPEELDPQETIKPPYEPIAMAEPAHIELLEEHAGDRISLNGSPVIASRTLLMRHTDVVAIKPFPRSKTGPTIEFQCQTGSEYKSTRHDDHKTRTTRFVLQNWPDEVASPPFIMATYRGKQVKGMIHLRKMMPANFAMWSLTYTLFYPTKPELS